MQINVIAHKCLIELRGYGNAEEYHQMLKKELLLCSSKDHKGELKQN